MPCAISTAWHRGEKRAHHLCQVAEQAVGAALRDGAQGQDGALPGSPVLFLNKCRQLSRRVVYTHAPPSGATAHIPCPLDYPTLLTRFDC